MEEVWLKVINGLVDNYSLPSFKKSVALCVQVHSSTSTKAVQNIQEGQEGEGKGSESHPVGKLP